MVHASVCFAQVVTLSATINSHNSGLITLLVSNNFIELKGNVFKRFQRRNLFQLCGADAVERFYLFQTIMLVLLQKLVANRMQLQDYWYAEWVWVICAVMTAEFVVDYIKHSFITKFNQIEPREYYAFRSVWAWEFLDAFRESKPGILCPSHRICSQMGFVPIPLIAVSVHVVKEMFNNVQLTTFLLPLFLLWVVGLCLKFAVELALIVFAHRIRERDWKKEMEEAKKAEKEAEEKARKEGESGMKRTQSLPCSPMSTQSGSVSEVGVKVEEGSRVMMKEEWGSRGGGETIEIDEGRGGGSSRSGEGVINRKTKREKRKDKLCKQHLFPNAPKLPEHEAVEVEMSPRTVSPSGVRRCKSEGDAFPQRDDNEMRGGDETEERVEREGGGGEGEANPSLRSATGDLRGSQANLVSVGRYELTHGKIA
eukprot:CAMPEP_0113901602 /NCGR_PEP_ID=MMETSP0780_2-20120614/21347_1 /TAXON_ID=652834 /ORGANISM="Palpitomonas bilix" /LENGTH=424 /DNA_ID=CAMNT_0000894237 /DNA_START=625 /DNA_END=1899 /DNA_ORIENTATION=- /assembly_acc=CAM_ASM_000599